MHPINVDSVCWLSERKTLLASFFALTSLILYVRFAQRRRMESYLGCLAAYVLALLSKPITVPLPAMMLLMDYWPLKRISFELDEQASSDKTSIMKLLKEKSGQIYRLVLEKIPLIVLSLVSIYVSMLSLKVTGQVGKWLPPPLGLRIENALSLIHISEPTRPY